MSNVTNSTPVDPNLLYPICQLGMILPLIDESSITMPVRMVMYFVGLIWSFIGVAIVADIFMVAIEGKLNYFSAVRKFLKLNWIFLNKFENLLY
jgi:hypothetical protein